MHGGLPNEGFPPFLRQKHIQIPTPGSVIASIVMSESRKRPSSSRAASPSPQSSGSSLGSDDRQEDGAESDSPSAAIRSQPAYAPHSVVQHVPTHQRPVHLPLRNRGRDRRVVEFGALPVLAVSLLSAAVRPLRHHKKKHRHRENGPAPTKRGHYNDMSKQMWDELFPIYDNLVNVHHRHAFAMLEELHPRFKAVKRSTLLPLYKKWVNEGRPDDRTHGQRGAPRFFDVGQENELASIIVEKYIRQGLTVTPKCVRDLAKSFALRLNPERPFKGSSTFVYEFVFRHGINFGGYGQSKSSSAPSEDVMTEYVKQVYNAFIEVRFQWFVCLNL